MPDPREPQRSSASLLKGLFLLVSFLVLAALGYTGWIVAAYWDRVGV